MGLDYQIINVIRFLKAVLLAVILSASSAHALENSNYQSNLDASRTETIHQKGKEQQSTASCAAYFKESVNANNCRAGEVPLPAASWLFLLALIGFVGLSNKRKI
jgi:hypothetical protein